MSDYPLTSYSHGAGCGCKISPAVLDQILNAARLLGPAGEPDPKLIVGNDERDDAAVYDLGDGTAVVSTTDFFMPIVDDPADFGRIAAVNAISDVYAMGGEPMLAIAILGWPIERIPAEVAGQVVAGARAACAEVGIPLAGGHSIDSPEPIFGLAVTGRVRIANLKRNGGARVGDLLYLTKPLGVGILATAQKQGKLAPEHATLARDVMVAPNRIGVDLGKRPWVHSMTDVTGFGLLGHLRETCAASGVTAKLDFAAIPRIAPEAVDGYIARGCVPGGTGRNWASYGEHVGPLTDHQRTVLADPQTSGGLLVAIAPPHEAEMGRLGRQHGIPLEPIGVIVERGEHLIVA